MRLRIGLSTCPNDTFAIHAILERKIDIDGFDLDVHFSSVQELNEELSRGLLDFSKASCHAALHLSTTHGVLRAGASMGIGSGPLLLAARDGESPASDSLVLCLVTSPAFLRTPEKARRLPPSSSIVAISFV